MTHLEIIKAACLKANPEIEGRGWWSEEKLPNSKDYMMKYRQGPIRLADVLLAIENPPGALHEKDAWPLICLWNLREDNLESQSDECLHFIGTLLA